MINERAPFVPGQGPALGSMSVAGSYVGDGAPNRTIQTDAETPEGIFVSNTAGAFALKIATMPGDASSFGAGVTLNADGSFTLSGAVAAALNVLGVNYYWLAWH